MSLAQTITSKGTNAHEHYTLFTSIYSIPNAPIMSTTSKSG